MDKNGHPPDLLSLQKLFIRQKFELAEVFGFETRNRYQIVDELQNPIAYAGEEKRGIFGFLFRQFLGHWRRFNVYFFNNDGAVFMTAKHPFRWFFQRIEIHTSGDQYIGAIQRRFEIFSKRFDIQNSRGQVVYEVRSPFFNFWTFTFGLHGKLFAQINKKWSGILSEAFTDRDNFMLEYYQSIDMQDRLLILAASVYVDILYFENKAR